MTSKILPFAALPAVMGIDISAFSVILRSVILRTFIMSATFSKLVPQSLASTLSGVGARECDASLAYVLFQKRTGLLQTSFTRYNLIT